MVERLVYSSGRFRFFHLGADLGVGLSPAAFFGEALRFSPVAPDINFG